MRIRISRTLTGSLLITGVVAFVQTWSRSAYRGISTVDKRRIEGERGMGRGDYANHTVEFHDFTPDEVLKRTSVCNGWKRIKIK